MRFSLIMLAGVATIITSAILLMLAIPAYPHHNENPGCTTIDEDVVHFDNTLKENGAASGKIWLWSDNGYSISFAASPIFPEGQVILSFYDQNGCLMQNPGTGAMRTPLPLTDKIRAFIARSKLIWSNTDKILLISVGFTV